MEDVLLELVRPRVDELMAARDAEKDAEMAKKIAEKDAEMAEIVAENQRLREQLEKLQGHAI